MHLGFCRHYAIIRRSQFARSQHTMQLTSGQQEPTYENAIRFLVKHQHNKGYTVEETRRKVALNGMKEFLQRVDISDKDLDSMKVIHVTGTKGKGSTCAFVESILRQHGVRTGFLSSPHLLENRERIRINGKPISRSLFAKYFWNVYTSLKNNNHLYKMDIPPYFHIFTLLSFYVFKHENVDAAIIEASIGGENDQTNVVKHPVVCGVSSIGIDHIDHLGDNIASVAWHKSGIFRENVPAFTVQHQPLEAMKLLQQRADGIGASLHVAPELKEYSTNDKKTVDIKLGLAGNFQKLNASLALQLSKYWLNQYGFSKHTEINKPFTLDSLCRKGLSSCHWTGRAQVVKFNSATFYLDGAHTAESIQFAADWFKQESEKERKSLDRPCMKMLAINVSTSKIIYHLLSILYECGFDKAIFTPAIIGSNSPSGFIDETINKRSLNDPFESVIRNRSEWSRLLSEHNLKATNDNCLLYPCAADAIRWMSQKREAELYSRCGMWTSDKPKQDQELEGKHVQVLVTGSLSLLGIYLRLLCPDVND
ncbi:unnamed protein product [Clavelina lepadiformis]|uniref:Folylpolyglutamate synthase n=1 Tax=Clavelina lepadiformis TaxID=159417 RepID=A0ABP0EYD3_CLALP